MTSSSFPSFWELVVQRAELAPDQLMLVDECGRTTSFGAFRSAAEDWSEALDGLGPGDRVAWQLPTSPAACVLAAALARLGVVQVPLLPGARHRDLEAVAAQVRPCLLVVPRHWRDFDHEALALGVAADHPGLQVLALDDLGAAVPDGLEAAAREAAEARETAGLPAPVPPWPAEARWVFFTSGTTGAPKGVVHADAAVVAAARGMIGALGIGPEDRHAVVFPIAHVGGIVWLAVGLLVGLPQLLVEAFVPESTIPAMARFGVTLAGAGTAFHLAYLAAQRASPGKPVLPEVRAFPGGAAPKPPGLHQELRRELGGRGIVSGYGLTECPVLAMNSPDDPDDVLATTEGRALPGVDLRVAALGADPGAPADAGRAASEVAAAEVGELRVRAPQLFLGYVDPATGGLTYGDALDGHGCLRTGDLGHLDGRGHVTVTGRSKDVIIRKGETVAAKAIEDVLYEHPLVAEVAVIGVPDPEAGERICAVVVPADAERPPGLEELTNWCAERGLMRHQHPERLACQDALPVGPAGKVAKEELRRRVARQSGQATVPGPASGEPGVSER